MKKEITIVLAPTYELALTRTPEATVEAEYGSKVVEGSVVTLAHHVEAYRHHPAPCNAVVAPLQEGGEEILISHLDLDTLGGIMALMGCKPVNQAFWEGAEFIDLNGPHRIRELPYQVKEQIEAYWAWADTPRFPPQTNEVVDVTERCKMNIRIIERILNGDEALLESGRKWAAEQLEKTEVCLIEEDKRVRVFATNGIFTAAQYYSPKLDTVASITISYNTAQGSITVATSDGSLDCCQLTQELFGPEAGGHTGIAGTPRNVRMSLADFMSTVEKVRSLL